MSSGRAKAHGLILACAVAVGGGFSVAKTGQLPGWTHYVNARWGFCIDYPSGWKGSEAKDGSGVMLYPYPSRGPNSGPYISISGTPDQPDVDNANVVLDDSPPLDLEGNFRRALENLRKYDHASDIRVLERRTLEFQGYEALSTKFLYETGSNATQVADETLWINREYIIFTATLWGTPRQVDALKAAYREIVEHRFKLICGGKR